jgi:hypothetical protein
MEWGLWNALLRQSRRKIVGVLMTQTPNQQVRVDFENAVMPAIVGNGGLAGTH